MLHESYARVKIYTQFYTHHLHAKLSVPVFWKRKTSFVIHTRKIHGVPSLYNSRDRAVVLISKN